MLYFKNPQLAIEQHVTLRTVLNWIQAAKDGRLDLDLHIIGDKSYVANTARNVITITRLVDERRKYRNQKASKTVKPKDEFYKVYTNEQIYDILTSLEIHHEIPLQYSYFNGGATYWDNYTKRLAAEDHPNTFNSTMRLLELSRGYIDTLLAPFSRVNVVDIGVGNGYPAKDTLTHLITKQKLGRYIGIDISPGMLEIAQKNIQDWFGDSVQFEGYELDVSHKRFTDILARDYFNKAAPDTVNIILVLGGVFSNFRKQSIPLQVVNDSMGANDLLIHSQKLDTTATRRYFDFSDEPGKMSLAPNHRLILDMFNIDESLYDVEMGYDADKKERYIRIRLKITLNIRFNLGDNERVFTIDKGGTILVWRAVQRSASDVTGMLTQSDFYVLQATQTEDQEYIMTVSRVKRD